MNTRLKKQNANPFAGDFMHQPVFQLAGAVILIIAGSLLTYHLRWTMDIFFLDETGYLVRGMNMFPKIPKLWGPLYCFWYKLLSLGQGNPVNLFFLNFGLMSVLLPIVLYGFLLRFKVVWPVALWLCLFLMIAPVNLPTFPKVSHFAAIFGLVGIAGAYYIKDHLHRYLLVAVFFLMLSYVRPESYLAFLAIMLGILVGVMTKRLTITKPYWLLIFVGFVALLHLGLGMPLGVELRGYKRSFIAFGEHFAYNYSKWNDINAYLWLTWESVVKSVFGDSRGMLEALRENPEMMYKHLITNAKLYVSEIDKAIYSVLLPVEELPVYVRVAVPAAFLISLLVRPVRRLFFSRLMEQKVLLVLLFLLALPSIVSCIVVYPREHYIIMQLPVLVWLLAYLLSAILLSLPSVPARRGIAIAALLLAGLYFINPRQAKDYTYFTLRKENGKLNNQVVLKMFEDQRKVFEGARVLSHEGDFSAFVTPDITFINAIEKKDKPFTAFLEEVDPDIIYCTETIFKNPNYMDDDTWIDFFGSLSGDSVQWEYFKVNGGQWDFLLIKDELYETLRGGEQPLFPKNPKRPPKDLKR